MQNNVIQTLLTQLQTATSVEWITFIAGMVFIVINLRVPKYTTAATFLLTGLLSLLFHQVSLYASMVLQGIFSLLTIPTLIAQFGYQRKKDASEEVVEQNTIEKTPAVITPLKVWGVFVLGVALFSALLYVVLGFFPSAVMPYPDAFLVSVVIGLSVMIHRRYKESWIIAVFMNIAYSYIYFSLGLVLATTMYIAFAAMAWYVGKKEMQ